MPSPFNCGQTCAKQAGWWYLIAVLLVVTAFSDGVPDVVKGICLLAGGSALVIALLLYRTSKKNKG